MLGDRAFAFVADPSGPADGRWWRRGEAEGSEESPAPPETRMAVALSETGYRIEAAVPMGPLTERTPEWRPPFAGRSAGFFLLAADPDGGAEEVSQILYGGDDDNDANWATLRFVEERGVSSESTRPRPVLGRLVVPLSPDRAGEFPKAFAAALLPVLERHGFQAVEPPYLRCFGCTIRYFVALGSRQIAPRERLPGTRYRVAFTAKSWRTPSRLATTNRNPAITSHFRRLPYSPRTPRRYR